jgi:hypothetical protein
VLDGDVAFLNVYVGRAVFTHGAKLYKVTIGLKFAQGEQQIQRANDVVYLSEHRMFAVDHGIRSGALLGKVHNRFGFEILYYVGEKIVFRYIADKELNDISGEFPPNSKAIGQRTDGRKGLHAKFVVPLAAAKIIDNRNRMPLVR